MKKNSKSRPGRKATSRRKATPELKPEWADLFTVVLGNVRDSTGRLGLCVDVSPCHPHAVDILKVLRPMTFGDDTRSLLEGLANWVIGPATENK